MGHERDGWSLIPGKRKRFFQLYNIQTGSYQIGTGGFFPLGKAVVA
jgi:hypothetical protein